MAQQAGILQQHWTDILPPVSSGSHTMWWMLAAAVLFILAALVTYLLMQQAPRARAGRELRRCRRQLHANGADTHQLARRVFAAFMQGLGLVPATAGRVNTVDASAWQLFYRDLQDCVFRPVPPPVDELDSLIKQAQDWLRRFPA